MGTAAPLTLPLSRGTSDEAVKLPWGRSYRDNQRKSTKHIFLIVC